MPDHSRIRVCPPHVLALTLVMMGWFLPWGRTSCGATPFPRKPIKVIVYTGPGGLLDMTARKFADVAKAYTDATFVVENKPGAGGIVAIEKVLQMPADGYTLYACTKSNIAKVVSANRSAYLDELHWVGLLIKDPECIITRRGGAMMDWQSLLSDARQRTRPQIWLGPATGGQDHVFAMKTWDQFGITATWVPFSSGGEALVALLGDQGIAYVGNPRDAVGNPNLQAIVVSNSRRLTQFPDTPVFSELGAPNLDNEFMWRGFALRQGCPPPVLAWYDELFRRITADARWRSFWEGEGMEVVYENDSKFSEVVKQDSLDFEHYLQRLELIQPQLPSATGKIGKQAWAWCLPLLTAVVAVALTWTRIHAGKVVQPGQLIIPAVILVVAMFCFARTLTFPRVTGLGAAAVPQLWIALLTPLCVYAFLTASPGVIEVRQEVWRTDLVWGFIGLLALYWIGTYFLGYYLSSAAFLIAAMYLLGVHSLQMACLVAGAWLTFAYLAFGRLLYVPLPAGRLFERFL
jgi:tripartite-type tricarboxylate transporter receptor subunit TctC